MRPQPFDSDVPPEKAGFTVAMIEGGEHADRAHDMPVLLDQTGVGIESGWRHLQRGAGPARS